MSEKEDGSSTFNTILKAITDLKIDLKTDLKNKLAKSEEKLANNFNSTILPLTKQMNELSSQFEAAILELKEENKKLFQECEALKVKCTDLSDAVTDLKKQLGDQQQRSRASNIEIVGVPVTPGESVLDLLSFLAKAIGVQWRPEDISVAHRVQGPRKQHSQGRAGPSIVVQYVSRATRATWIMRLGTSEISTLHSWLLTLSHRQFT